MRQDADETDQAPADQSRLGRLVRAHRMRAGLSQEELAERAGLSERTVRNLEGGRIRRPYPATLRRLADALALVGDQRDEFQASVRGMAPLSMPDEVVPS